MRFETLSTIFQNSPSGSTPLCYHIRQVIEQIRVMEPQLRASGQKACVMIATDGESSDGDIASAMRPLQMLPVWVVIRLCTDDEKVVEYWNNIDSQLELEMDVLSDMMLHSLVDPEELKREQGVVLEEIKRELKI